MSCTSSPEPPAPKPASGPTPKTPEPAPTHPTPFTTHWPGTTWIIRNPSASPQTFPGYKGIHLGPDGMVFPINLENQTGGQWSATEHTLTLSLSTDNPLIPSGTYTPFLADTSQTQPPNILLTNPEIPHPIGPLEQARPGIDIMENHWIPQRLTGSSHLAWPKTEKIYFIILPGTSQTLSILGYGGVNRFRGPLSLGTRAAGSGTFRTGPLAMTRRHGPSSGFENLYINRISQATHYLQVDSDLYLYQQTSPLAAFRVRLFD